MISTLVLVAANLLPLLGVAYWGWDAFELLVLYWLETAIIAFWTIVQVGVQRRAGAEFFKTAGARRLGGAGRAAFFTLHTGLFMAVHFIFLWTLFSGGWRTRVHGPWEFVRQLVIDNGVWVPLAVMFVVRGATTLFALMAGEGEGSPLRDLYGRIITLQFTILLGGWLIITLDNRSILFLLVAIKVLIDLFYDPFARTRRDAPVHIPPPAP